MKFTRMLTSASLLSIALFGLLKLELVAQETRTNTTSQPQVSVSAPTLATQGNLVKANTERSKLANEEKNVVMTYFIGDLILPHMGRPLFAPNVPDHKDLSTFGGITLQDFDPLQELILKNVAVDSWKTGGRGTLQVYVPNLSFIISNTKRNHELIEAFLKKVRELAAVTVESRSFLAVVPEGHEVLKDLELDKPQLISKQAFVRLGQQVRPLQFPTSVSFSGQPRIFNSIKHQGFELTRLTVHPLFADKPSWPLVKGEEMTAPIVVRLFCSSGGSSVSINDKNLQTSSKKKTLSRPADQTAGNTAKPIGIPIANSQAQNKVTKTGYLLVSDDSYARFDVTKFMENPPKGKRAVMIFHTKVHDKRAEITKLQVPVPAVNGSAESLRWNGN